MVKEVITELLCGIGFNGVQADIDQQDKSSGNNAGDESDDPLALTRSLWSLLINNAYRWAHEGWGAYVNANSALYLNPVLSKEEAQESMRELVEWGQALKAAAAKDGEREAKEVGVIQGEYNSWGHFFKTFADDNSAVSALANRRH